MRRRDPRDIYHAIKYHAIEIGVLIVFLTWLTKEVIHQIR